MHPSKLPKRFPESTESLVNRLRRLPEPLVPNLLEAKLLAAVPTRARHTAVPRRAGKWCVAVGAIAAVVLAAVVTWPRVRGNNAGPKTEIATIQTNAPQSPRFNRHDSKETDPCNILPPLADWR
jgi:hypothetical protein